MEEKLNKLLEKASNALSLEKIEERLNVTTDIEKEELNTCLKKGLDDLSIIKTNKDKYILIEKTSFRKGRFFGNKNGEGKVVVSNPVVIDDKILYKNLAYEVDSKNVNGAIDGDVVLVSLYSKHKNSPVMACIKQIVERNLNNIVGEVYLVGNKTYVRPLDKRKKNLIIRLDKTETEGQRVAVNLEKQIGELEYKGKIVRYFNHKYDPNEELLLEAFKCGVDFEFSEQTLKDIKKMPTTVRDIDKIGRSDLTNKQIFTIDGVDTKDIDDALSCEILSNGNYLIGVHIADVSHYVKINSSIDKDAFKRGTSVYFPGGVIPMLPRELSNGICSLNPDVERLAITCFIEVTKQGQVISHNIVKSIIKSKKKMNYDEVNNLLHGRSYDPSYEEFKNTLINLNDLALVLRQNRIDRGAIEFDRVELKLEVDDDDKIVGVKPFGNDLGENLIEEFMLLANETIDKHLISRGFPCLHRIHDTPSLERMEEFFRLLHALGNDYINYDYFACCNDPNALQDLSMHIQDMGRLSNVLSTNLVKCMSRAQYTPVNIGHFGLALDNYCHFTSPIRRYPDLTVHRLIKAELENKDIDNYRSMLPDIGLQSSKMERISQQVEIRTFNMRAAEYMEQFIGEEFNGVVIGVGNHGLEIELDNYLEARVRVKDLDGDYLYSPDDFSLISMDGHDDYNIGDYLKMKLLRTNKLEKTIELGVIEKIKDQEKTDSKVLKR